MEHIFTDNYSIEFKKFTLRETALFTESVYELDNYYKAELERILTYIRDKKLNNFIKISYILDDLYYTYVRYLGKIHEDCNKPLNKKNREYYLEKRSEVKSNNESSLLIIEMDFD